MNSSEILEKLVAFPTVSSESNAPLIGWVARFLEERGARVALLDGPEGKQALWAAKGPDCSGGLALCGHTDVVPTVGQNWQSDPYALTRRGDALYGRGACDMKGFLACALSAFDKTDGARLSAPLSLGLTYDEETTMAGAKKLAAWLKEKNIHIEALWLGEPTKMEVITSHKGVVSLKTRFSGACAHASLPERGLSAVSLALRAGAWIEEMARRKRAASYEKAVFDPPYTTFNLGRIDGGTANNVVADSCLLGWEFRSAAQTEQKEIQTAYKEFLANLCAEDPRARAREEMRVEIPPFEANEENKLADFLCPRTGDGKRKAVSYATEAGYLAPFCDSLVICGPGAIENAHQPDESVPLVDMAACEKLIEERLR